MDGDEIHMPWLGRKLEVIASSDPTYVGRSGLVIDETQRTIVLMNAQGEITLPKNEIQCTFEDCNTVIDGKGVQQRAEDRIHRRYKRS